MLGPRSRTFGAVTLLVGLATVFALALPEGSGGRDSVVRLTRGGLQRHGCADTAAHGHDEQDSGLDTPAATDPPVSGNTDGSPAVAVVAPAGLMPMPPALAFTPAWPAPPARPAVPAGGAAAGRAPPAI